MLLSDAIALGRTLLSPCAPDTRTSASVGCALDMAVEAIGGKVPSFAKRQKWQHAAKFWPWLRELNPHPVHWGEEPFFWSIPFKFDRDVMGYIPGQCHIKPTMTLDAFIDWVRSIEPPEPAEQPVTAEEETEVRHA